MIRIIDCTLDEAAKIIRETSDRTELNQYRRQIQTDLSELSLELKKHKFQFKMKGKSKSESWFIGAQKTKLHAVKILNLLEEKAIEMKFNYTTIDNAKSYLDCFIIVTKEMVPDAIFKEIKEQAFQMHNNQ